MQYNTLFLLLLSCMSALTSRFFLESSMVVKFTSVRRQRANKDPAKFATVPTSLGRGKSWIPYSHR
jgi:hypothetical protein